MPQSGDMVRAEGRLAKVVMRFHEYARVLWIDGHGVIRQKWLFDRDLTPLEVAIGPRSIWPEAGQLDALELEREEKQAKADRLAKAARSRKARRSQRIKGRPNA